MGAGEDTIEVTFTPTFNELLEAARSMNLRGTYYIKSVFYTFVFFVMGVMFYMTGRSDFAMAFVLAAVLYVASPYWHLPWRISRLRKRAPMFREPMTVRLSAEEISSQAAGGGSATLTRLAAVRQSKNTLLLVINPDTYIMVPKRAFESPEHFARAEAMAKSLAT